MFDKHLPVLPLARQLRAFYNSADNKAMLAQAYAGTTVVNKPFTVLRKPSGLGGFANRNLVGGQVVGLYYLLQVCTDLSEKNSTMNTFAQGFMGVINETFQKWSTRLPAQLVTCNGSTTTCEQAQCKNASHHICMTLCIYWGTNCH